MNSIGEDKRRDPQERSGTGRAVGTWRGQGHPHGAERTQPGGPGAGREGGENGVTWWRKEREKDMG